MSSPQSYPSNAAPYPPYTPYALYPPSTPYSLYARSTPYSPFTPCYCSKAGASAYCAAAPVSHPYPDMSFSSSLYPAFQLPYYSPVYSPALAMPPSYPLSSYTPSPFPVTPSAEYCNYFPAGYGYDGDNEAVENRTGEERKEDDEEDYEENEEEEEEASEDEDVAIGVLVPVKASDLINRLTFVSVDIFASDEDDDDKTRESEEEDEERDFDYMPRRDGGGMDTEMVDCEGRGTGSTLWLDGRETDEQHENANGSCFQLSDEFKRFLRMSEEKRAAVQTSNKVSWSRARVDGQALLKQRKEELELAGRLYGGAGAGLVDDSASAPPTTTVTATSTATPSGGRDAVNRGTMPMWRGRTPKVAEARLNAAFDAACLTGPNNSCGPVVWPVEALNFSPLYLQI